MLKLIELVLILIFTLAISKSNNNNNNNNNNMYRLTRPLTYLLTEKASKFIVLAQPVQDFTEGSRLLEDIRKKYADASHNCWAFSSSNNYERSSDDGEPTNSAGKPMLNAIKSCNIADVMVICTRYFGGTELGVGGLVRAYSSATKECLLQASLGNGLELIIPTTEMKITSTFEDMGIIYQVLASEPECVRISEKFIEEKGIGKMIINIELPTIRRDVVTEILKNRCKGRATIVSISCPVDNLFYIVKVYIISIIYSCQHLPLSIRIQYYGTYINKNEQ